MDQLIKSFWKYASTMNGVADLDDAFITWASKEDLTLSQAKKAWEVVNTEVLSAFGVKTAAGDIIINNYGGEEGAKLEGGEGGGVPSINDASLPETPSAGPDVQYAEDMEQPPIEAPVKPEGLEGGEENSQVITDILGNGVS